MVLENVLSYESPDLVVLNGDLITSEDTHSANATHYLDMMVKPLVQRNMFWASTYGNHDAGYNLSAQELLNREHKYAKSLTQSMVSDPDAGVTNYWLPIFSSNHTHPSPALLLWFFDSRGGHRRHAGNIIPEPGFVHESVCL